MAVQIPTSDDIEAVVRRAIEPLRVEIERLQGSRASLVPLPEAARRLGVTLRSVQHWAKNGRLETEWIGGVRLVRLPAGIGNATVHHDGEETPQG